MTDSATTELAPAHEPCPICGGQPEASKGKTYWTARCPKDHFLRKVVATPMKTKNLAFVAWDDDVKHQRI